MKFTVVVNDGNKISSFDLENAVVSLGRSSDNDIQLDDKHVSRNHLILWGENHRFFVKDLGSENGTYVNGRQIPSGKVVELRKSHSILVGKSLISLTARESENVFVLLQPDDTLFQRISPTEIASLNDTKST
jgi:pSer/pThr/pTyr-binding forkhead associated (FHA) protein